LRGIGVVETRRQGTSVFYRVDDPQVFALLAAARSIIGRRLAEQQSILRELETS
jgi:ArsR family transcriptional regulator